MCPSNNNNFEKKLKIEEIINQLPKPAFLPNEYCDLSLADIDLNINFNQIAFKTSTIKIILNQIANQKINKCLLIGSGLGYLATAISYLCDHLYISEINNYFCKRSAYNLALYSKNSKVNILHKNGIDGLELAAPYDLIIYTCTLNFFPSIVISEQLKIGGNILFPLHYKKYGRLISYYKNNEQIEKNEQHILIDPINWPKINE